MNNDDKMRQLLETTMPDLLVIYDLMHQNDILPYDVMRALYLIANIKRISKYGKVSFIIKNNEIVSVNQEQALITEKELRENLKQLLSK